MQESWVAANPGDIAARRLLAGIYRRAQRQDKVIEQYKAILALDDDNLAALNNLAWYALESNSKQALGYAMRAAALSPDSAAVLDTLALAYYHTGDFTMARRSLRRALNARPDDPSILYHEAMLTAAEGDRQSARASLERLLGTGQAFPEKAEAEKLLGGL